MSIWPRAISALGGMLFGLPATALYKEAIRGVVQLVLCVLFLHRAPESAHGLDRRRQFCAGAANEGGIAKGTVRVAASRSELDEYPITIAEGIAHVYAVSTALSTFGQEARLTIDEADGLDDAGTADLFTEISRRRIW